MGIVLLGGLSDWLYLNVQEYPISLSASFVEYLSSYASAFLIAGIEIAATYYFFTRYDLGSKARLLKYSTFCRAAGFARILIGEVVRRIFELNITNISVLSVIYLRTFTIRLGLRKCPDNFSQSVRAHSTCWFSGQDKSATKFQDGSTKGCRSRWRSLDFGGYYRCSYGMLRPSPSRYRARYRDLFTCFH